MMDMTLRENLYGNGFTNLQDAYECVQAPFIPLGGQSVCAIITLASERITKITSPVISPCGYVRHDIYCYTYVCTWMPKLMMHTKVYVHLIYSLASLIHNASEHIQVNVHCKAIYIFDVKQLKYLFLHTQQHHISSMYVVCFFWDNILYLCLFTINFMVYSMHVQ